MLKRFFKWLFPEKHICKLAFYPPTGETLIFHWGVPWGYMQTFTVCNECKKVKVLSEAKGKNSYIGTCGGSETDGQQWSGKCDYAKVPSIGRDKLVFD